MQRPRGLPHWQTAASAVAVAAAMPPWDLHFLIWVALVPWLSVVARESPVGAVREGFWLAFATGVLVAPWIAGAAHEFLGLAWPLAALVVVAFAALCAQPHWIAWAIAVRWCAGWSRSQGALGSLLVCATLAFGYSALEALVPRLFDVGVGYALHDAARLRQVADLGGVALLSFGVALVNTLAWRLWEALRRERRASRFALAHAAAIAIVWGAGGVYGAVRLEQLEAAHDAADRSVSVGVVQGNVANAVRLAWARGDDRAAEKQLSAYMLPTEEWIGREPPLDWVVWPEATYPGIFRQAESAAQRGRANKFDRQVLRLAAPIIFGAYDREEVEGEPVLYNSLFAITPRYDRPGAQGVVQRYRKHHLLPFAETVPGLPRTSPLRAWLPPLAFFGRGPGATTFDLETPGRSRVRVAPAICSESLAADHAAEGARLGAEVILNVGSDGWFGPRGEPQLHLAVAKLRSVETRLPQVRAANTGISALILPSGELVDPTEFDVPTTRVFEVTLADAPPTLFVRWGDWFGRASIPVAVLLFLLAHRIGSPDDDGERDG